jgi:hypothetical protein
MRFDLTRHQATARMPAVLRPACCLPLERRRQLRALWKITSTLCAFWRETEGGGLESCAHAFCARARVRAWATLLFGRLNCQRQ